MSNLFPLLKLGEYNRYVLVAAIICALGLDNLRVPGALHSVLRGQLRRGPLGGAPGDLPLKDSRFGDERMQHAALEI